MSSLLDDPLIRHLTQILFDLRQHACVEFRQSDENLDVASDAQELCGIALTEQSAALLSCFRQTQWYPVLLVFLLQRLSHFPHIIIFENGDSSPAARKMVFG